MTSWRNEILDKFVPGIYRLTIVADPDGLMLEEGILRGIKDRGFEMILFEDHVEFRFAYESRFRSKWDREEPTDLVVVLRSAASDLQILPYDLIQAGHELSFDIGTLFPNLSYPVVDALDRSDFDCLYRAQTEHNPGVLGNNATKDFILRHVFQIDPELISKPSDLLRMLLRKHYMELRLPSILNQRIVQVLGKNEAFQEWELDKIVPGKEAFFAFLQERWPVFLNRIPRSIDQEVKEEPMQFACLYAGPADLPFGHDDVRVYIDNLFLEGMLHPVEHDNAKNLAQSWAAIGVITDSGRDALVRIERLMQTVEESLPGVDSTHQEWQRLAQRWAELIVLKNLENIEISLEIDTGFHNLEAKIDSGFLKWVEHKYASLHNQPPVPPVMVHHIPRSIARFNADDPQSKVALIVIDGLSIDQWLLLRDEVKSQNPELVFQEETVFAWIPTLTSVSRQAIFSGKAPLYFPDSIESTGKEEVLWERFWQDRGFNQSQIVYLKNLGKGDLSDVEDILTPQSRVVGLVINTVDKIMHGIQLGTAGMHNQVRQWSREGYLPNLIDFLLTKGFHIWITSDHGNIEAQGCGRPKEGVIANIRGERVRIFSDQLLLSGVKDRFPDSIDWPPIGLPENFLSLIAPDRKAFIIEPKKTVTHGGVTLEEVIVPFVKVERKQG